MFGLLNDWGQGFDGWLQGQGAAQPGSPYQDSDYQQARQNLLLSLGTGLLAAGQPMRGADRAQILSQLGGLGGQYKKDLRGGLEDREMADRMQQEKQFSEKLASGDIPGLNQAQLTLIRALPRSEQLKAATELATKMGAPGEGFSLSPGQTRYDASGNPIVSAPGNSDPVRWDTVTTEAGVFARNPLTNEMQRLGDRPNRNEGEGREFKQEDILRDGYFKAAKPFVDLRTNYQRIQAASKDETGASDIAMVYSFMKMLDPTSVVREGEFATAENAGGVDSRITSLYNRVLNGQRLSPQVRSEFLQQSARQFDEQWKSYGATRSQWQSLAKQYGLDPERVAPDLAYGVQRPDTMQPQQSQQPGAAIQPGHIEDGYRFRGGDPSRPENWEPVR